MIYTFTPFSTEKNFGKAINRCCEIVPDSEDWICIRDGDAMNLTPDWGNIIQDAVDEFGNEYQLFGCWTNRLNRDNGMHQLVAEGMYSERDILCHHNFAVTVGQNQSLIKPVQTVAGFFLLFQKKTWIEVGKFDEETVAFDTFFCDKLRSKGGKIGLINRLYMFHLYRIWAKGNPGIETKHLQ